MKLIRQFVKESLREKKDVELPAADVAKEDVRRQIQVDAYEAINSGLVTDDKSLSKWFSVQLKRGRDPLSIVALKGIPFAAFKLLAKKGTV